MFDVEVFGLPAPGRDARSGVPGAAAVRELCIAAAARAGVRDGHLAVSFVDAPTIAALNAEHRGEPRPTDVLSFPIDGSADPDRGGEGGVGVTPNEGAARARVRARARARHPERELGDVVICIDHTIDVREAIVHGVLHLAGMDHETDDGEMLALQREVLAAMRPAPSEAAGAREAR